MKFTFDKTQPRLTVTDLPAGTTKVTLNIPEQNATFSGQGIIEIGNFSLSLNATLIATKEEIVTSTRDVLDEQGNVIDTETIESTEVTILESQTIDLRVL